VIVIKKALLTERLANSKFKMARGSDVWSQNFCTGTVAAFIPEFVPIEISHDLLMRGNSQLIILR
jgi:hypothetical protein